MGRHVWVGTGEDSLTSCLICGGVWDYNSGPLWVSHHVSLTGDPAVDCTGNKEQCHHYEGECPINDGSPCQLDLACNCLSCFS